MSDGSDWHDPFAEREADLERERRRAAREAARRQHRQGLADKVSAERGSAGGKPEDVAPAAKPAASPERPASPPSSRKPGPKRRAAPAADPTGGVLRRRRVIGLVALAVVLVLGVVGIAAVADRLGDDDEALPPVAPAKVSELTIPEGLDAGQIAEVAKEAGLRGDYEQAARGFRGFDPGRYGAGDPPNLEGFLFPATYELPRRATVDDLISRQLEAFEQSIKGVDLSDAESKNLNEYDVLKIASMVEREIQVPEERPLAAAVIY
ncbi:MAG: endolytic transglycosylase MltG, partial [Solirubrobacterales bacterium]